MTGQTIEQLVANQWVERLDADDAEVLGFWQRAIESYDDAATPRLSRTGQFKLRYDAARQGVVALNAAHGYRAKGPPITTSTPLPRAPCWLLKCSLDR